MFKLLLCLSIAVAAAVAFHYEQDYHHTPKYSYKYDVKDPHTHDMKSHWETRDGDKVFGSYRMVEPDGTLRIVDYMSDKHNGYRAVVTREKHGHREVTFHGMKGSEHGHGGVSQVQTNFGGNSHSVAHFSGGSGFGGHHFYG